jgi:hypothetical protein
VIGLFRSGGNFYHQVARVDHFPRDGQMVGGLIARNDLPPVTFKRLSKRAHRSPDTDAKRINARLKKRDSIFTSRSRSIRSASRDFSQLRRAALDSQADVPTFAQPALLDQSGNRRFPRHRPQTFFPSRSFSAALSSIDSASSFFRGRFSSSNDFRRRASDTSPPYLAFHL